MNLGANPMSLTSSTAAWQSSDGVSGQFPAGLRVLVVDDDPTCLKVLEHMLRKCLYEVTTCSRAEVALKLLRDNRDGFDIVISEVHMPDVDGFKLLEHVGLEMDLPVVMMSADDSKNVVMKGVTHGACAFLIKPVRIEELRNIWQHVVRTKKHEPSEDVDCSSSANEGNWRTSNKRKKPRVVWSVELHQQFVTAVNQLGIDKTVPKKILDLMNAPGLTREDVASHLQNYRLYLRWLTGQHQNGLGNSFMGPQGAPYGPITSYNGLDILALASSGQLQPKGLATIQATTFSRAANKSGMSVPLVGQRNIYSFDNPKMRFVEGQQQQNEIKMNDLMTKSFTSYVDLKKEAMKDLESGPDLELGMTQIDQNLTAFVEAEEVNKEMNSIREILARLQDSHEEGKTFHQPEALTLLRARVNADIVSVLKWARAIRAKLEDMDKSSAMNRRLSRCKAGSPVDRTCCAVTNGLRKKLKELMMEFQGLRQRMMTEYKETVGRRYFTVTGEYPNEDVIEKIISSGDGNGGEELLSGAIQEHGRGKVLETVVEIQDRHDSAKETEKSLLELHQIFLDMVLMVDAQGEQMDDIEHNVINAAHYTIEHKIAKQPQKSSRRGLCVGIILLLLLILLVIIPIATNFRKSRFSWNHIAGIHSYFFSAFGSL